MPVLAAVGGVMSMGFLLAIAAGAIALMVLDLPVEGFRRLATLWKPIVPIVLVPCIWMLVQIAPVSGSYAHPAWASASAALGEPLAGHITLDIGATLLSLCRYSLALAIAIVATAVALDRQRADAVLVVLSAAATSIAAALVGQDMGLLRFGEGFNDERSQMLTIVVVGLVLSCAMMLRTYDNYRRRRPSGKPDASTIVAATASIAAMVVCLSAVAINADAALLLATAAGILVLLGLAAIHRWRFGPWGQAGIAATAAIALIGFFAASPANRASDLTLALSSQPQASIAAAERMLFDAKWTGTGAGTFGALLPIYRDVGDALPDAPPTAAAAIAIELGRPLLWLIVILALIGTMSLIRRALMRGREYFYAGTGAACIVAVLGLSFANAGVLGLGASLLASVICSVALAQSRSWSA
jgi:hypothetical protein